MAARSFYSHKQLIGKKSAEMQEMIFAKGQNFNDYPAFFKRGTYVRRVTQKRTLTQKELMRIPEKFRPGEEETFERSSVERVEMPRLSTIANRVDVIFDGAEPVLFDRENA
jgi:tRNA(His) 5'-end guanylyltransferase